jgi:hypothetical protein
MTDGAEKWKQRSTEGRLIFAQTLDWYWTTSTDVMVRE